MRLFHLEMTGARKFLNFALRMDFATTLEGPQQESRQLPLPPLCPRISGLPSPWVLLCGLSLDFCGWPEVSRRTCWCAGVSSSVLTTLPLCYVGLMSFKLLNLVCNFKAHIWMWFFVCVLDIRIFRSFCCCKAFCYEYFHTHFLQYRWLKFSRVYV